MIKKNLFKAVLLSVCIASSYTGSAFAMAQVTPKATEELSPQLQALYTRQSEIDKLLFEENAKKIEELGFMVNSTSVVEDKIEISISPYDDKFADFVYDIVGRENVTVVEMDQSILYATGAVVDPAIEEEKPVSDDQAGNTDDQITTTDKATASDDQSVSTGDTEDGEMQIQIESTDAVKEGETSGKIETISATDDVRTVSTEQESAANPENSNSATAVVFAIAGGVVLLGGTAVMAGRRKTNK